MIHGCDRQQELLDAERRLPDLEERIEELEAWLEEVTTLVSRATYNTPSYFVSWHKDARDLLARGKTTRSAMTLHGQVQTILHKGCFDVSRSFSDLASEIIALTDAKLERAVKGLASIAENTCCDGCLEASKVARDTLKEIDALKEIQGNPCRKIQPLEVQMSENPTSHGRKILHPLSENPTFGSPNVGKSDKDGLGASASHGVIEAPDPD